MTKLNIFTTGRLLAATVAVSAAVLLPSTANASLLFKYSSSASAHYTDGFEFGSLLCAASQDGSQTGNLNNAFNLCLNWRGFSIENYGQSGKFGCPTYIVVQDSKNDCYVWNVSQCWNEANSLDFSDICDKGSHITSITCYGDPKTPSTNFSVPEPSTIIAGALLLLPLGISMTRILRRNKMQPVVR